MNASDGIQKLKQKSVNESNKINKTYDKIGSSQQSKKSGWEDPISFLAPEF